MMTPDLMRALQRLRNWVVEAADPLLCLCRSYCVVDLDATFAGGSEDLGRADGQCEDVGLVGGVDGVRGEVLFGLGEK